jgi:hypothetical protein
MRKIKTTLEYLVPDGLYCNHKMAKSNPSTRCRFCTEVSKGVFVCVIHNLPLLVESGYLILKTVECMKGESK